MKKTLIAAALVSFIAMLTACSSTPKAVTPAAAPPITTNQALLGSIPGWYVNQPANTANELYSVGTARSADLSMVEHKAVLDAQSKLAFKLKGEVDTITKDYKRDSSGQFDQTTEQATQRLATNVKIAGYMVVERLVVTEGTGFRSFVLLKFPLGESNTVTRGNAQNKVATVTETMAKELHKELSTLKQADLSRAEVVKVQAPVVEVSGDLVIRQTPAGDSEED